MKVAQPPYNDAAFLLVGQCVNNYIVDVTFLKRGHHFFAKQ